MALAEGAAPMPVDWFSSTSVFHSPQASQRPDQRGEDAPQFWQTKEDRDCLAKRKTHMFMKCSGMENKGRQGWGEGREECVIMVATNKWQYELTRFAPPAAGFFAVAQAFERDRGLSWKLHHQFQRAAHSPDIAG